MTESSPVTEGLLMIHRIVSRGINTSISICDEYSGNNGIPSRDSEGISMFIKTLKWVTHSHHTTEDELAFPYFRDHITGPYDRLREDHLVMASILDKLDKSLVEIPTGGIKKVREVLSNLNNLWVPHIKIEEENFTSGVLNGFSSLKEQIKLVEMFGEHGSKNSGPGPLALPFMFYNLEAGDRRVFVKSFPWIVKRVLVPILWKNQWKPMSQYLLPAS